MNENLSHQSTKLPIYFGEDDRSVEELHTLCQQITNLSDYPMAEGIEENILLFDGSALHKLLGDKDSEIAIRADMVKCLRDGPGVFIIKGAYQDTTVIDESTKLFQEIITDEKTSGQGQGDHFGANERIWNSVQKVCLRSPSTFIDYFGNPFLALASTAWLGPFYQITAQMNNVKPQSPAQSAHRDYHLGFQSKKKIINFPAHAQVMSQFLTLQGAIAHADTPLVSGPTLFLPYSQKLSAGYLYFREPKFAQYFEDNHVQLPLDKGDMVFFSPALFHGAGCNQSEHDRVANLVQVSSAFGRPMETVNRYAMIQIIYPELLARVSVGTISERKLNDVIAAVADGYSFPTNLDSDPPIEGNAPVTAQDIIRSAINNRASLEALKTELENYAIRRQA